MSVERALNSTCSGRLLRIIRTREPEQVIDQLVDPPAPEISAATFAYRLDLDFEWLNDRCFRAGFLI